MADSKARKQSKINKASTSKSASFKAARMEGADLSQGVIRERAYQLYESRNNEHGRDKEDWFHAEKEITGK